MSKTLEVDIHVWINSLKNLLYVASFSSLSETTSRQYDVSGAQDDNGHRRHRGIKYTLVKATTCPHPQHGCPYASRNAWTSSPTRISLGYN